MLRTVIDLTNKPEHQKNYSAHLSALLRIKEQIETRIYPELEQLFQQDSETFDQVIQLRNKRNAEKDEVKRNVLAREAKELLKRSTEIPLSIAECCLELGAFAAYVFDNGFQSARGDSNVALTGSIAGVGSCLSIVELNLISLPAGDWMDNIRKQKSVIKQRYETLLPLTGQKLEVLENEAKLALEFHTHIAEFQRGNLADSVKENADIEKIARHLQDVMWAFSDKIWKANKPQEFDQVLRPVVALRKIMDYAFSESDALGTFTLGGQSFEVAGIIDKSKKLVRVSKRLSADTMNFTVAHELGHAILHKQTFLHRDRPTDGSSPGPRNKEELQADKFAAYFLMPEDTVKDVFKSMFKTLTFSITQSTIVSLNAGNLQAFRNKCKNVRGLARELAGTEYFEGQKFNSISKFFNVSTGAMAIRLEELGLVKF